MAMNANELCDKTPDELRAELVILKKEQFNLRFQKATGQSESTVRMKAARREAARVLTIFE
jgi:large subunit ribosomal protein L29